jgi:hypothetical protein
MNRGPLKGKVIRDFGSRIIFLNSGPLGNLSGGLGQRRLGEAKIGRKKACRSGGLKSR